MKTTPHTPECLSLHPDPYDERTPVCTCGATDQRPWWDGITTEDVGETIDAANSRLTRVTAERDALAAKLDSIRAAIAAKESECEQLRKDAERYRGIRAKKMALLGCTKEEADASTDRALYSCEEFLADLAKAVVESGALK